MDFVSKFLKDYCDLLLKEHKEKIEHFQQFLRDYENLEKKQSKHGLHYTNCSWSRDDATSGPDTCGCYDVEQYRKETLKLITFYKRVTKDACSKCRNEFDSN